AACRDTSLLFESAHGRPATGAAVDWRITLPQDGGGAPSRFPWKTSPPAPCRAPPSPGGGDKPPPLATDCRCRRAAAWCAAAAASPRPALPRRLPPPAAARPWPAPP